MLRRMKDMEATPLAQEQSDHRHRQAGLASRPMPRTSMKRSGLISKYSPEAANVWRKQTNGTTQRVPCSRLCAGARSTCEKPRARGVMKAVRTNSR